FASKKPDVKRSGVAVVYTSGALNAAVFEAVKDQSRKDGLAEPLADEYAAGRFDPAETVRRLRQSGREAVLFLGGVEEALALMSEAGKLNWFPTILLPGAGGGAGILDGPAVFDDKLFFPF